MKKLTYIFALFIIFLTSCGDLVNRFGQSKYFEPTDIVDRTQELAGKNIWTSLNDNEKIDGYTRIGDSIFGGEIACNVEPLENIDLKSFKVLAGTKHAKDTNYVYYPIEILCVDYTDCGVCYYSKIILENANPSTFGYLGKEYAADDKRVYFRGELLRGADAATFRVIEAPEFFHFGVDKYQVYDRNIIFKDADPATFYYNKNDPRNEEMPGIKIIIGDKNNEWEYIGHNQIKKITKQ